MRQAMSASSELVHSLPFQHQFAGQESATANKKDGPIRPYRPSRIASSQSTTQDVDRLKFSKALGVISL